ncbi:MAG TPA: hypothetical protein VGF84_21855 [Micromonosporaceae bacterium]|jgi:hypothetical protein
MEIRSLSRALAALCLVVGPLALAIPATYSEADTDGAGQLRLAAGHLGMAGLSNALLLPAILIVPAMIYAARLARRGSPRLAFFGGGIAALGWLAGLIGLGATGLIVYHGVGLPDQGAAAALIDRVGADPTVGTLTLLFVLGHVVGMILLGVALLRSRAVPVWAAVLFIAYPLVHLGAHIGGSVAVDDISGILLLVAGVMCAISVLRLDNGRWDLPSGETVTAEAPGVAVPVGS